MGGADTQKDANIIERTQGNTRDDYNNNMIYDKVIENHTLRHNAYW